LSANKIGQQKPVVCHAKIGQFCLLIKSSDFIVQLEHVLFLTIESANFLDIGYSVHFMVIVYSEDEYLF